MAMILLNLALCLTLHKDHKGQKEKQTKILLYLIRVKSENKKFKDLPNGKFPKSNLRIQSPNNLRGKDLNTKMVTITLTNMECHLIGYLIPHQWPLTTKTKIQISVTVPDLHGLNLLFHIAESKENN